jgi:hypothetical protein
MKTRTWCLNVSKSSPEKSQIDKFKAAARELETDDSEEHFDATLKRVAKTLPKPKKIDQDAEK